MRSTGKLLAGSSAAVLLSCFLPLTGLATQSTDLNLVDAVLEGDAGAVRELLQNNADVNATQPDGSTALVLAADRNDLEVAALLIQAGVNVDAANEYGATALSVACARGNSAMIKTLLEANADPNRALLSGETPLMTAVNKGNADAVRGLLEHGANVNAKESNGGQTALMWAVAGRHTEIARLLVGHGADVHARSKGDFSALLFAAQQGDVESGRILLEVGTDVNDTWKKGPMTALMVATANGRHELSVLLLEEGADPELTDARGYTALHHAALDPQMVELVKTLLAHGANPDPRTTTDSPRNSYAGVSLNGATPLLLAASAGNVEAVRALVAGGADPLLTTDEKTAPLHVAAGIGPPLGRHYTEKMKSESLEIVKLLMELGADANAAGEHGWTALHGAAYMGIDPVVQFLVEKGAKMDVFDEYGQTALSIANAVISVGVYDHYFQSSRIVRQSTADLLLKLGATPLADSGVQILSNFYKQQ